MIYFAPENTEILKRVICVDTKKYQLVLGLVQGFSLSTHAATDLGRADQKNLWQIVDAWMDKNAILDEGWPKEKGEFLAYGACYPGTSSTGDQPVSVRINIGNISKQLAVWGNRQYSTLGLITRPKPFTRIEISPENAFGGEGYAHNSMGKGYTSNLTKATDLASTELPNVELPSSLISSKADQPTPAGFWALASDTPRRSTYLGQFDETWKKKRWPHLPMDTRPEYFQAAPHDQQAAGYFSGTEIIEIHNMHPKYGLIQSQLPGLRARVLVNQRVGSKTDTIREYNTNIDTVWLFPEAMTGFFLSRCVIPVLDADAQDTTHIFVEFESVSNKPQVFEQLEQKFKQQIHEQSSPADDRVSISDEPVTVAKAETITSTTGLSVTPVPLEGIEPIERSQEEIAQQLSLTKIEDGVTMATLPPEIAALLKPEDWVPKSELQTLLEFKAEIEKSNTDIRKVLKEAQINNPSFINSLKSNPETAEQAIFLQSAPSTIESMMTELEQNIDEMIRFEKKNPTPVESTDEQVLDAARLTGATTAVAVAPENEVYNREWVIEQHRLNNSFKGFDLSGLDLSNLDLTRVDFQEAILTSVNFSKSRLSGAILEDALINEANFEAADLSDANMRGINAENANFNDARMERASMREADFTRSDFSRANIGLADLKSSILTGVNLTDAQAQKITADDLQIDQANCTRTDFSQARMPKSNFYGSVLSGAKFNGANCKKADFSGVTAVEATFEAADLSDSQADFQSKFDKAIFNRANLAGVNWNKAALAISHFDEAILTGADFTGSILTQSRFVNADAKNLCLDRCDLSAADLSGINLFEGSLRNSNLQRSKIVSANLYGVDLLDAKLDGADYQGSVIAKTILEFRQP